MVYDDAAIAESAAAPACSPPIAVALKKGNFASFTHRGHPGNRIGYRFFEHTPIVHGKVPRNANEAGIDLGRVRALETAYSREPGVKVFKRNLDNDTGWVSQRWVFYLAPADDGIKMLWVIETDEDPLPRYYGAQQCFRMSGRTQKKAWKKEVALTPAFSEYDLWASSMGQSNKTSLTYVCRDNSWEVLPATESCLGARTPLGIHVDKQRCDGLLPDVVGPYKAAMLAPIDSGLVTRTDLEKTWVCGIFWENTSHVTNHHPADCLHTIVNIGNIPVRAKRAIRGKIYWFKGNRDDLLRKWVADFGHGAGTSRALGT